MISEEVIKRFTSYLKPEGDCLVFTGHRNPKGYGMFRNNRKTILSHRFAWIIENGPIPKGMMILHRCDHPPCCATRHLWMGTAQQNTDDMISKGRQPDYTKMPKGEKCHTSFITNQQAREIISLLEQRISAKDVSLKLNISIHIVRDISSRASWTHLPFNKPDKLPLNYKNCIRCDNKFKIKPYEIEKSKYCSRECYWNSMKSAREKNICIGCKKEFEVKVGAKRIPSYCKIECLWNSMKGKYPEKILKSRQ